MSGIRYRFGALPSYDRFLLLLAAGYSILGLADNYFRLRSVAYQMWEFRFPLAMVVWASTVGLVAYSFVSRQRTLADYGFSCRRGGLASLAAVAALQVYVAISGKLVPSAPEGLLWSALAVFALTEEILFRVIAIDKLILLMDGVKGKVFWAIVLSSALFSAVHIPSKSPLQVQGLFLSSLILGYVYSKTRSVLLPAWMHASASAGFAGGVFAVVLYWLAIAAGSFARSPDKHTPLAAAAPTNR